MKQLTVELGERSYPIYIGDGLLSRAAELFERHGIGKGSPLLVVTDTAVGPHYLAALTEALQSGGYRVATHTVEAGEKSKSLEMLDAIVATALEAGLDRKSTIVALGGGVVGDLAGFAAASFMRGVRFVQVPTTILAHDSSVGGKVAVNHRLAKNIIGAFHQPELVLYDTATLLTLPPREVRSGLAEMVKHGLIWNASFVDWLDANAPKLLALDPEALQYGLYEGCKVKAHVVAADEREDDLRAILNLGHTIGHALEAVAGYGELLHGEAIAIGMVGAAKLAGRLGYASEIYDVTKRLLKRFELPVQLPAHLDTDAIMAAMSHDKKFKEGRMVFIVPTAIGKVEINKSVQADWVREIVDELKGES
ncbi:3-dehydroquinate synthase [Paenibacillus chartarius]|uniref:3-dehydroquinate synthase n=1 Tax=Paenibacillus chartarius TaxID=747481 RepID=A0ABV6DQD0_9BACL